MESGALGAVLALGESQCREEVSEEGSKSNNQRRTPRATIGAGFQEQLTPVFTVDAPSYVQSVGRRRRFDYVVGCKDDESSAFDDGNQMVTRGAGHKVTKMGNFAFFLLIGGGVRALSTSI